VTDSGRVLGGGWVQKKSWSSAWDAVHRVDGLMTSSREIKSMAAEDASYLERLQGECNVKEYTVTDCASCVGKNDTRTSMTKPCLEHGEASNNLEAPSFS
jgi:hypothetical protein